MNDGNVNNNNKTNNNYVWPVRGGEWKASPRVLFAELYQSYLRCRRNKRSTLNAMRFESNAEENLYLLAEELADETYRPSRSIRFAVDRPKLREIVAADFRDRVVHHYLVERLEQIFEPIFIHDSYACRVGKGVHAALARTRDFIRQGTKNNTVPLYALHLDVKNFFMTIDKRILTQMVEDRLVKEARRNTTTNPPKPISANLNINALDFPLPFQGEGRGGDGVDCMISTSYHKHPHPHPNLPLEREGTKSAKLAHIPLTPSPSPEGRGELFPFSLRTLWGLKERVAEGRMRVTLPFLNRLARTLIAHNPMARRIDKGDRRLLAGIPPHKTLLHAPFGVGLPVGNLTSQFFANVYLNELDQYCKHALKCRYYVRYCDDFLILDSDPKRLEMIREDVRGFLAKRLRLELNTRYAAITDVRNGIDFIGYIIRPDYVLVRRRSVNNLRQRLDTFERDEVRVDMHNDTPLYAIKQTKEGMQRLRGVVASYSGHFKFADTRRLRRSIFRRYPWLNALYRLDGDGMPRQKRVAN